jgi:rhodanese-related sulfurtransferase
MKKKSGGAWNKPSAVYSPARPANNNNNLFQEYLNMLKTILSALSLLMLSYSTTSFGDEESSGKTEGLKVKITRQIETVDIKHEGKTISIQRNQNTKNLINPAFAKTSRKCPPFCIQPLILAPGVETIGERKMLEYLQQVSSGNDNVLVIDSRSRPWVVRGTIPGTINIPFKTLSKNTEENITDILEDEFGVTRGDSLLNFTYAKTLVLFCNGLWCGQAPTNIKSLLKLGYPAHKLKYYRGGMQAWESLGLTTIKAEK